MSAAAAAAAAAAQVPRTFRFISLNNTQIQCTDSINTNVHNHELVTPVNLRNRFIADIAKDGPAWQYLHPILIRIYNHLTSNVKNYYDQQLAEFTNIDDTDSNITPYPNIPKSSNNGLALKVLEPHVNTVFNESGYGPDRVCQSYNPTVIYTPASLLDSCLTKGNTFWPSRQDKINIVFDNIFMQRMGFYGTQWEKNGDDISITYTAIQGENPDVIIQPVTDDMSVDKLQTDASQPINRYMQGNPTKNYYLSANVGNLGNNIILKNCIKLIETKELGDFMQVLLYLAYIMIERPDINNVSMITTDNIVFAVCRKLRIPCLYTGCRLDIVPGHAIFYKYTPGLINYLEKLKSMIKHRYTTVLTYNKVTIEFLVDITAKPNKLKFIINNPRGRGHNKTKIIYEHDKAKKLKNKAHIDRAINTIKRQNNALRDICFHFLRALTSSEDLIINGNTYINSTVYGIIEAGQQQQYAAAATAAAAAAAPTAAAAAAPTAAQQANDGITKIYNGFKILSKKCMANHIVSWIDNDSYILHPGTKLFNDIMQNMDIEAIQDLTFIISRLQDGNPAAAIQKRSLQEQYRLSKIGASAAEEAKVESYATFVAPFSSSSSSSAAAAPFSSSSSSSAAAAPFSFLPAPPPPSPPAPFSFLPAASAASPPAPFSFLPAASAASAAPADSYNSAASYGSASSYAAPPNPMNNKSGGAINFENDYKELMQCINAEIENKDSELVTNLFLCYAFQLLITMQDVMEYGLSKSDKLFELAIKSTNPNDISSLNELVVYNEFINSIHYYSIKDKKNSDASLYFGSYLLALDHDVYHYQFAIIYDNLISTIDSDTVLNKYQIGEICGTNDNNILKYGKILKKYINFIDDNSDMMKNIEKSVAEMIKNTIDMTKTPTTGNTILMTKTPTTSNTKKPTTGNTNTSTTGKTKAISNFKNHPPNSIGVRPPYKIPVGGSRKKHNRRKKIDTRKRQRKHKHKSRKHSHAAIRTSKARPASRRFR